MLFAKSRPPLTVVVTGNRWNAYGDPEDIWQKYLFKMVQKYGIDVSVPDGQYHFNVEFRWFEVTTYLEPIE